ncbi:MAG: hypothetical protein ACRDKI_08490 [Solirubrobacterales bacterium]
MTDSSASAAPAQPPADNIFTRLRDDRWMLGLVVGGVVALIATAFTPKTITGLPAHPLLLHMPVIFVPCLAVAAIAFSIKPEWRERYDIAYGIGAIVTAFGTLVAANAGESYLHMKTGVGEGQISALAARDPEIKALQHHADLGGDTKVVVSLLAAVILIQIALDRNIVQRVSDWFKDHRAAPSIALAAITGALAVAAATFTLLAGHAGAKLTFGHEERDGADRAGQLPPGAGNFRDRDGDGFQGGPPAR